MKFPVIDSRATGVNLRRIMDARNITVKDLKEHLGLSSIQSVYHWLNGICLPSIDNLYAMSFYFRLPIDDLICGSGDGSGGRIGKERLDGSAGGIGARSGSGGRIRRRLLVMWEHFAADSRPDWIEIVLI